MNLPVKHCPVIATSFPAVFVVPPSILSTLTETVAGPKNIQIQCVINVWLKLLFATIDFLQRATVRVIRNCGY